MSGTIIKMKSKNKESINPIVKRTAKEFLNFNLLIKNSTMGLQTNEKIKAITK
ncbi:hypothetical protein GCM10011343_13730 [Flavobacterium orientale]|uniref:Uncharacterized protein n=1 Tax=Flavobacterium orientale TaxID=1756020 RepID=A0A916Y0X1_9FLAO|nr:hypothetical protein GCM10011343_13730 [Flavobacterium orientale]